MLLLSRAHRFRPIPKNAGERRLLESPPGRLVRAGSLLSRFRDKRRGCYIAPCACASAASSSSATILVILIIGLTAGPAVSL